MKSPKTRVLVFLVLTIVLTVAVTILDRRGLFGHAGSFAAMWTPGIAALIASILTRRSLFAIGWRPRFKWLAIAWLIPVAYGFVAYGLVWLTGLGAVPNPTFLERARIIMNMPAQPNWIVIVSAFFFITIYLLIPSMISSLGEEIGWRGYLVPELTNWVGFRGAALASGAIWTAWHLPAILFFGYGTTGTPKAYQVFCFTILVMTTAVIMAWVRLRSGSVWSAVMVHAVHNAVIQLFFNAITANTGKTAYFVGEFGIALALPLIVLATYCFRRGISSETNHAGTRAAQFEPAAAISVHSL